MADEIKRIMLKEQGYSHQGTGRNGIYYTLMVDGEPIQLDSWINPDARKYAYLFKAAPDLLEAVEMLLIGAAACAIPHHKEREVLQTAVDFAIKAKNKAKGGA